MPTLSWNELFWLAVPSQNRGCEKFIPVTLYQFYAEFTKQHQLLSNSPIKKPIAFITMGFVAVLNTALYYSLVLPQNFISVQGFNRLTFADQLMTIL